MQSSALEIHKGAFEFHSGELASAGAEAPDLGPFRLNQRALSATANGRFPRIVARRKRTSEDKAAHACRALCRTRVAEDLQRRRGTRIGEHLKLVLSYIDRQQER
jgi:hypothetical protein